VSLRVQNLRPAALRNAGDARQPSEAFARLVGKSARWVEAVQRARLFANVVAPLLLRGETGVGKDAFARAIHESGAQRRGRFVAISCAGLPPDGLALELFGHGKVQRSEAPSIGKLEEAQGGTLFLDQIADLSLDLQACLLRVLDGDKVYAPNGGPARDMQVRLICGCDHDLRREVKRGRFRPDLLYRISTMTLTVPPLRERVEDLSDLVAQFADEASERHGLPRASFTPEVLAVFTRYAWPGNVRELRNVVESMVLTSADARVDVGALPYEPFAEFVAPPKSTVAGALHFGVEQLECEAIRAAIRRYDGNLTLAAKTLRIARSTLYLKMKKYTLELDRDEVRSRTR
jgi:DNA-binding NtrC family response regulator